MDNLYPLRVKTIDYDLTMNLINDLICGMTRGEGFDTFYIKGAFNLVMIENDLRNAGIEWTLE